jgi:hypothetical protein
MKALETTTLALVSFLVGCAPPDDLDARTGAPLIYGSDDREEYFEVERGDLRATMASSVVALVPRSATHVPGRRFPDGEPSFGEAAQLCEAEPFFDQPASAFCSGVLLDWDLVLTAGHCVRLFAPRDISVVFNYLYKDAQHLEVRAEDIHDVVEIVAERLDGEQAEPLLDFAWVRLAAPVHPPKRPAAVYLANPLLTVDELIIAIGTGGGVPLKADAGGRVRDPRGTVLDYFVADTDSSEGQSGGAAFDDALGLLGILARGGLDFEITPEGCNVMSDQPDPNAANEQFTYAFRAVEALCRQRPAASSLCRADCGEPCQALPEPVDNSPGGCAVAGPAIHPGSPPLVAVTLLLTSWALARTRRVRQLS